MLAEYESHQILSLGEGYYSPHYQPILDVGNRNIVGYEVLGRVLSPETKEYHSLGYHFHNPDTDAVRLVHIDRIIREKAIKHLKDTGLKTKMFLNMMPNFLSMVYSGEVLDIKRLHILHLIDKYDINPTDMVLEITEDKFEGNIEKLLYIVSVFRERGIKIAVDDLGVGFSNLERIGYIHPDIMKVDIKIMRESLNRRSFKNVLAAISEMSQRLGSQLLFEGVETEEELYLALSMGANLLQGFYFSKPALDFQDKKRFNKTLKNSLEKFSGLRFLEIVENLKKQKLFSDEFLEIFKDVENGSLDGLTKGLEEHLSALPKEVSSVLVCDLQGYQVTPTFQRDSFEVPWIKLLTEIGNNYAWKPFFIHHKAESFHSNRLWGFTEPIHDIDTKRQYVLFTLTLGSNYVLVLRLNWELF
ncbi:cyclic diguanylate phosphodiesterase (EAL) domain protein [Leptospira inadai serovar Lyme str. 10]|uniref:Cyclic diguanylate phosphodiesterase (EAL) domain protein n=2 Tax=Leptospira inadai serovar Lyme TaxID=293084 RepID=V6HDB6_9LEPT|nr:EAL domain-containing protein [Leptospira inadai]EQA37817.1 cyclic diguanylate phosphodiesterase (EAL) domain protein [Leptospira inadai serovar Lyme str. 10]PNV74717.1 histidine kinase [Leptospira inadai serovar Lyme]